MGERKIALIIANYRYEHPDLRQLAAPAQDAESLARVLADRKLGGFEVRTAINEPSSKVNLQIEDFCEDRKRDDLLLIYFSGHGIKDADGQLYFATVDTQLVQHNVRRATAVSARFVNEVMSRSRSRRQILLLDCCYSGAFKQGMLAKGDKRAGAGEQLEGQGRIILTASDALQYSFEGECVEGEGIRSIFTRTLVQGLETGEADLDRDGFFSLDDVYNYVYARVSDEQPEQKPTMMGYVEGKIFLGTNPRPLAAKLPQELLDTLESPLVWVRVGAVQQLEKLLGSKNRGLILAAQDKLAYLATSDDSQQVRTAAAECLAEAEHKAEAHRVQEEAEARETVEAERKTHEVAEEARRKAEAQRAREEAEAQERAEAERRAREGAEAERARQIAENQRQERERAKAADKERVAAERAAARGVQKRAELEQPARARAQEKRRAREKTETEGVAAEKATPNPPLVQEKAVPEQVARPKPEAEPEPSTRSVPSPELKTLTLLEAERAQLLKSALKARPAFFFITVLIAALVLGATWAIWHARSNQGSISNANPAKTENTDAIRDLENLGWKIGNTQATESPGSGGPGDNAHALDLRFDGIPPRASLAALQRLRSPLNIKLGGIDESISDWAPLKNLSRLDLSDTKTSDVSVLRSLTQLRVLDLSGTKVSDLSPLANLNNLLALRLQKTAEVANLSPLRGLSALSTLVVTDSKINDISPLEGLTRLSVLDLSGNLELRDLSPIRNLTSVSALDVSYLEGGLSALTGLNNLSLLIMSSTKAPDRSLVYLEGLRKLSALDLSAFNDNQLRDISPLRHLTNLSILGLNSCSHISDFSPLHDLQNLTALDLGYTPIRDLSPLNDLSNLRRLSLLWAPRVTDVSPLSRLGSLSMLELYGTGVTDVSPLRNLTNLTQLSVGGSADVSPLKDMKNLRIGDIKGYSISYGLTVQFAKIAGSTPR